MSISRRKVLSAFAGMGGLILASGANKLAIAKTEAPMERFAQQGGDFSWQPQKLKLAEVEALGHQAFHYKGYG